MLPYQAYQFAFWTVDGPTVRDPRLPRVVQANLDRQEATADREAVMPAADEAVSDRLLISIVGPRAWLAC